MRMLGVDEEEVCRGRFMGGCSILFNPGSGRLEILSRFHLLTE